jgi:SAM-dependent methyltransferase
MNVQDSYDAAAEGYAEHLANELDQKPLDRHLLNRFAEAVEGGGLVADLGCGPGHVARYLHERGVHVVGIDLSSGMVDVARRLHPSVEFRVGDMTALDLGDAVLAGIVAFYSIVHFRSEQLFEVFAEFRRVLMPGGLALVAFHVGDEVVQVNELFGATVSLDFHFHVPTIVSEALGRNGLEVIERVERQPYPDVEYQSARCYLLAR